MIINFTINGDPAKYEEWKEGFDWMSVSRLSKCVMYLNDDDRSNVILSLDKKGSFNLDFLVDTWLKPIKDFMDMECAKFGLTYTIEDYKNINQLKQNTIIQNAPLIFAPLI